MSIKFNLLNDNNHENILISPVEIEILKKSSEFVNLDDYKTYLNTIDKPFAHIQCSGTNLVLVTDIFCQVPLFYFISNETIFISTELNDLITNKEYKKSINVKELCRYISADNSNLSETLWKEIFKVPPGHIIKFESNNITVNESYLQITVQENLIINKEMMKDAIMDAVNLYCKPNLQVATFLSGGIDSSIVTISNRLLHPNKKNFSFKKCSDYDENNEDHIALAVAKKHNLIHNEIRINEIDLNIERAIIETSCLPEYTYVPFCFLWETLQLAKKFNVSVILGGEFGDQVFGLPITYLEYLYYHKKWGELKLAMNEIDEMGGFKKKYLKGKLSILLKERKYLNFFSLLVLILFKFKINPKSIFFKMEGGIRKKKWAINKYRCPKSKEIILSQKFKDLYDKAAYLESVYGNSNYISRYQALTLGKKFNVLIGTPLASNKIIKYVLHSDNKENFYNGLGRGCAIKSFFDHFPPELQQRKVKTDFRILVKKYSLELHKAVGDISKNHLIWKYINYQEYQNLLNDISNNPNNTSQILFKRIISLKLWMDIYFPEYSQRECDF